MLPLRVMRRPATGGRSVIPFDCPHRLGKAIRETRTVTDMSPHRYRLRRSRLTRSIGAVGSSGSRVGLRPIRDALMPSVSLVTTVIRRSPRLAQRRGRPVNDGHRRASRRTGQGHRGASHGTVAKTGAFGVLRPVGQRDKVTALAWGPMGRGSVSASPSSVGPMGHDPVGLSRMLAGGGR